MHVFERHCEVLVELGIDAYHSLFERYFLLWVAILTAISADVNEFQNALLMIISQVNVSCSCPMNIHVT